MWEGYATAHEAELGFGQPQPPADGLFGLKEAVGHGCDLATSNATHQRPEVWGGKGGTRVDEAA